MDKFVNWGSETPEQLEIRRKYEEEMREAAINRFILEARQTANQAATAALGGGGGGETLPSNAIEFVASTLDGTTFGIGDLIVSDPIVVTVDWGDGDTDTYEITSDSGFSHSYTEREAPYTARLTFDDISLVTQLFVSNNSANVIEARGLPNLVNLEYLEIDNNSLISLNVSGMVNLIDIDASDNYIAGTDSEIPSLTSIDLTGCIALERLEIEDNDFSEGIPDLTGLNSLNYLDLDGSLITGNVDISQLSALTYVDLRDNAGLTSVTMPEAYIESFYASNTALTETAVNNILQSLDGNTVTGGTVNLSGGTSHHPTGLGEDARQSLINKEWTVDVNEAPPASVGIAASTDFNIVGDFTIEMFVNMDNTEGYPRPYSFGTWPAPNAISLENGTLYFWANEDSLLTGSFAPTIGSWNHIAVMGSGSNVYMYVDGVQISTNSYNPAAISSQGLPLTIGYGNEPSSGFNGKLSNFRWTNDAVYPVEGFTVPTSPLADLSDTVLLIFQGANLAAQLVDNSGNNHNASNAGATFSESNPFSDEGQGSLQMGTV
jgi:hypothetical protein